MNENIVAQVVEALDAAYWKMSDAQALLRKHSKAAARSGKRTDEAYLSAVGVGYLHMVMESVKKVEVDLKKWGQYGDQ